MITKAIEIYNCFEFKLLTSSSTSHGITNVTAKENQMAGNKISTYGENAAINNGDKLSVNLTHQSSGLGVASNPIVGKNIEATQVTMTANTSQIVINDSPLPEKISSD